MFIGLELNDSGVLNEAFGDKDNKDRILLKIFKEILKSPTILCEFWSESEIGESSFRVLAT